MKKLFTFLLSVVLAQTSFAGIWLVDNNANHPTPYTSVQDVIDNHAINGDTIMVAGSPNDYGEITITKPLTLIGEGYNDQLGENTKAFRIYIRSSNVVVTGFKVILRTELNTAGASGNELLNVLLERCYSNILFTGGTSAPHLMRNIRIRNIISEAGIRISYGPGADKVILFDSLILENNIFFSPCFDNWGNNITGANTVIVRNNLLNGGNSDEGNVNTLFFYQYSSTNFHDAILYNNIFYNCNPTGSSNCTFMNNLTYGNGSGLNYTFTNGTNDTLPGPVNNNIYSQNPLLVNYVQGQPFSFNFDFHTAAGSPCIGAGVGGTEIGIYGGYYPFRVGEGPRIPIVDFINISNTAVPSGSTFYLQFDARTRH